MRLLVLTADYAEKRTWSGIGVAAANQALALAGLGYEMHVISPSVDDSADSRCNPRLYRLRRNGFPLRPRRSDVVHLHSLSLAALACELKRRFGVRLVYTAHSLVALELSDNSDCSGWSRVQQEIFAVADKVFFLTGTERELACSASSGLDTRSAVLPNGVVKSIRQNRTSGRRCTAMFAGRLTRNKGIDILVATVTGLLERGCDWDFIVAGGHGEPQSTDEVRTLSGRYPSQCRVTGWLDRSSLDELYSEVSLVLVPSRYEPFGMVALEAMSRGAPVLASGAGGLRSIVGRDSGGYIVDQNRSQSWIDTCEALMAAPLERELLSSQGPCYVAQHFDAAELAKRYLEEIRVSRCNVSLG